MAVGTLKWSGTLTLPATAPGTVSSIAVALAGIVATDTVVVTPSSTALQTMPDDVRGAFDLQVVKAAGVGFTVYASRGQLPSALVCDYLVMTRST